LTGLRRRPLARRTFARCRSAFLRAAILACWFTSGALAGDVEFWSDGSAEALRVGRLQWILSGGLRIKDSLGDLYDRRVGTVVGVNLGHQTTISAGYLIRNREYGDNDFGWDQRLTAAVGYALLRRSDARIKGLTLYERHFTPGGHTNFNRYRQRFEVESRRKGLSPWLYEDFTFLNRGFVRSRSRAGLLWRTARGYSFAVGYQFETIRDPSGSAWRPRHAIVISFTGVRFHILD